MFANFKPTKSKSFFVGRDEELQEFQIVAEGQVTEWIIHIIGPGGMGKTKLLEQYREKAMGMEKILITDPLIDFFNTSNQTDFGLLREMSRQLGDEHFPRFLKELNEFQRVLQAEPMPAQRQDAFNWVNNIFFEDYGVLLEKGYRIFILFDTTEEMHGVQEYVMSTLLPGIAEAEGKQFEEKISENFQTTIVMAGRQLLDFPTTILKYVLFQTLGVLEKDDIVEFFNQGTLTLTEKQLTTLYHRTGGRPLYIALSYDWLNNEVGTLKELLTLEPFGQELVRWVLRLPSDQKQVILNTAFAWRRMEPGLLAHMLKVDEKKAEEIIQELVPYSFIKYRKPDKNLPGALQLHDEMRDLINEYTWPLEGRLTREALYPQVIEWYKERIDDPALLDGKTPPIIDEDRALLAEYLFYLCQYRLEDAMETYEALFRSAIHFLDLAYCDLLNREVRRFRDKITPEGLDDLRFREALVAFRGENYELAENKWESLLRRPGISKKLRATTLMLLVELKAYTGKTRKALDDAKKAESIYLELLNKNKDDSIHQRELLQLYNNWGYAYRVIGDTRKAVEYYEKVLSKPELGTKKNTARTLNNIGYVYFLEGNLVKARTYVGLALKLRTALNIPYELGLGNNTMGIIMEQSGRPDEATDLYAKALLNFQNAGSRRGTALVNINLGRIWRVNNAYDVAIKELNTAKEIFKAYNDTDNLIKTLNELGVVYRHRGDGDDFETAETHLKDSLELSHNPERPYAIADNYADLAILYQRWHAKAFREKNHEFAKELEEKARKMVENTQKLTKEHGYTYLGGKSDRTLGDLEFTLGNYDAAFDHYLSACQKMTQAMIEGRRPQAQLQRRFDEMIDRLQEQLHALPEADMTFNYSRQVLEKLETFPEKEKAHMSTVRDFVEATLNLGMNTLTSSSGTNGDYLW